MDDQQQPSDNLGGSLHCGRIQHAFSVCSRLKTDKPRPLIPREDWQKEIEASATEETEWWKGEVSPVELMVELPFWLMVDDCEVSVKHGSTTVTASVKGHYIEVSDGPTFRSSHANAIYVGPEENLKEGNEPLAVKQSKAPIYRYMKTVVCFSPQAMTDAVDALKGWHTVTWEDRPAVRRLSRSDHYLQSLAYAHIPFLNHLITSYRSTSHDPYAYEVSEWDVPVWHVRYNDDLVRVGLMPYWESDDYPTLSSFGTNSRSAVYATIPEALQAQANEEIAPGKLELLDALSLSYRGRFGDAVRSAVTAIEIAIETQLEKLFKAKGYTDKEVKNRLATTHNSFFDRLADYEAVSQKRLPGPLVSLVPYINGVRLRSELEWVRNLRHDVVHQGIRVDIFSRGPMLRAIETMTWLFQWLSWEDQHGPKDNRNYIFFSSIRGQIIYPFEYRPSGVAVVSHERGEIPVKVADEVVFEQYLESIGEKDPDIDLFAKMSFEYLQIKSRNAPPKIADDPIVRERYHISHKDRQSLVFCLEFDGLIDAVALGKAAMRAMAQMRMSEQEWNILCIVHHQRHIPTELREVHEAIPSEIQVAAADCGITLITTSDLQLLVQGCLQYEWNMVLIADLLFIPGRQGMIPPEYRQVGTYLKYYSHISVMSINLHDGETVNVGDILGIRLRSYYYEQAVKSLHVEHKPVTTATGPCRVGIRTTLAKTDLHPGQMVFIRNRKN